MNNHHAGRGGGDDGVSRWLASGAHCLEAPSRQGAECGWAGLDAMDAARRRRRLARTALVTVLVCMQGALVCQSASASSPGRSARTNGGIPALVQPGEDLAAQRPGPALTWVDSIFIAGRVRGGGHSFGILVHTLAFPNANQRKLYVAVTDTTTGWYRNYSAIIPKAKYAWSMRGLHIAMPGLTWIGSARQMEVKATTPWGSLQTQLTSTGPVLNYSGNGLIQLLGDPNYEYAFPTMRTVGTLTAEGVTRHVFGTSWLDRQWGPLPLAERTMHWTWMNIALSTGDQLAVWDIGDKRSQYTWMTGMRRNGSYVVAAVRPLAPDSGRPWTSPVTHKTYPTRWSVRIPTLKARLDVAVTGPRGQEFADGHVEATAAVTGTYDGRKVTGTTYVEETGYWPTRRQRKRG